MPPFMHYWEPDFSEGEPALNSKTCGLCGREDDLYHLPRPIDPDAHLGAVEA